MGKRGAQTYEYGLQFLAATTGSATVRLRGRQLHNGCTTKVPRLPARWRRSARSGHRRSAISPWRFTSASPEPGEGPLEVLDQMPQRTDGIGSRRALKAGVASITASPRPTVCKDSSAPAGQVFLLKASARFQGLLQRLILTVSGTPRNRILLRLSLSRSLRCILLP